MVINITYFYKDNKTVYESKCSGVSLVHWHGRVLGTRNSYLFMVLVHLN